ncbi:MAG TPA: hypothetical protein VL461_06935 [Dictyobacter sp.]|jgi:hypothetical protein|nr:hypothetical protein [Dictyobacter sp.]
MHDTLASLVERALAGNPRPLEFYLREHSHLPGPRVNIELANDVGHLLSASCLKSPDTVRALIHYFVNGDRRSVKSNSPAEFVIFCGVIVVGICATVQPLWREQTVEMLNHYACSPYWRVRDAVTLAYQHLLTADAQAIIPYLMRAAGAGNYLQQRAAVTAIAEPRLLYSAATLHDALVLQRIVLENLRQVPAIEREYEAFKILRRALGYTLSVVTAAAPEQGFALMRECASWRDDDICWILQENIKKRRLARFVEYTAIVNKMISS